MQKFNVIKRFKTSIVITALLFTISIFSSCSDSATKSTETKDSTTNIMSDTSKMKSDTMLNRMDTGTHKGDQAPPVK